MGRCGTLALLATMAVALGASGLSSGAGARSAGVPYCPGSELNARNPVPDCIFRPSAYPPQAAKFDGTATLVSPPKRVGATWNQEFTVTMHYTPPYSRFCAANGASPAEFPCQIESYNLYGKPVVSFGINGAYVPGATTFGSFGATLESYQGCANGSGTCTETFATNTYSTWGHFELVIGMNLGYYVPLDWGGKSAVDGGAGFETAIAVTFPKLPGSSSVNLAAKEQS